MIELAAGRVVRLLAVLVFLVACGAADESEDDMLWKPNFFKPRPTAVCIEPVKGPWKNNPTWGNSFDGVMPSAPGAELPIFEGLDIPGPPRVQSVILFRNQADPGLNSDVRARVRYGIGAKQDAFDLDWFEGVQFSLVANYVQVTAISYRPNPINPYDSTGGSLQLGGGVCEGTVTKGLPAQFTETQTADAPATMIFEAPAFARSVVVWGRAADVVDIIGAGSLNPFTGTVASFDPFRDVGMALPGGTQRVIVTAGIIGDVATVQWFLGL